jgi:hypothetical protein
VLGSVALYMFTVPYCKLSVCSYSTVAAATATAIAAVTQ